MKDVDQRFALVDNTSGEKLFPYKSRQEKTGRFGFALSEPGKQNRKGEGIYTEDIHEVIDSVVNKGWKVRVKTIDGKRHGSMTINRNSKLSYWIASEFWDLVKNSPTGPMTLLPSNNSTANATRQFTDAEIRDLKLESEETENALVGFDGVDKYAVAKRRANQGEFRKLLLRYWKNQCCVSDLADPRLLVASHIIPWSKATPAEKGDPANGLLLSVTWDALFDRGLIGFRDDGSAILDMLDSPLRLALGIDDKKSTISQEKLTSKHSEYLKRHRELFGFASNA